MNAESIALSTGRRGTNAYRAPELTEITFDSSGLPLPCVVTCKSDIWAMGCILFKLATTNKVCAFDSDYSALNYKRDFEGFELPQLNEQHNIELRQKTKCKGEEGQPFWEQLNGIIKVCLAKDPEERPTARELNSRFEMMRQAQMTTEFGSSDWEEWQPL